MINGFALNATHCNVFGINMLSVDRTVLPAPNDVYLQVPNRDGSYLFNRGLLDRTIKVDCSIFATSMTQLRLLVRDISAWLFTQQRAQLIFDDEPDKYYMAKYEGAIGLNQITTDGEFSLIFRCEPHAYSLTPKTQNFVSDAISITNAGTAPTFPKFTVTFTAPATEFKLWFGNYYVRVVRNFVIGDVLVIDNSISKITVNGLNAMASLDLNSRFFSVGSGSNTLNVTPTAVANTTITMKERWL
jgi:predicted phage tail component-like protein